MSANSSDVNLGKNIMSIRKKHGISLRDLAEEIGISASMLSQVERGLANPSISTMKSIADALNEPLYNFFLPCNQQEESLISRAATRQKYAFSPSSGSWESLQHRPNGYSCEHLSPSSINLEMLRIYLPPHCNSNMVPRSHDEPECAYVESGTVKIELGDTSTELYEHDAVTIPARTLHRWINESSQPVSLVLVTVKSGRA